jgi:hypothetical protein
MVAGTKTEVRDLSKCFGLYQQQSVTYALDNCLGCSRLKACVRTAWGVDQPRRRARGAWDGGERRQTGRRPPPWPGAGVSLAT